MEPEGEHKFCLGCFEFEMPVRLPRGELQDLAGQDLSPREKVQLQFGGHWPSDDLH